MIALVGVSAHEVGRSTSTGIRFHVYTCHAAVVGEQEASARLACARLDPVLHRLVSLDPAWSTISLMDSSCW